MIPGGAYFVAAALLALAVAFRRIRHLERQVERARESARRSTTVTIPLAPPAPRDDALPVGSTGGWKQQGD